MSARSARVERLLDLAQLKPAPGPPAQVHLSVTDRCFLPCLHCDIHRNRTPDLPTQVWTEFMDRLARWPGPAAINFAGGEPLMRRDLEQLLGHAAGLGFESSFNTNGWLLTPRRAAGIAAAQVSIVYVSLDGVDEETVDRTRGRQGAFSRARQAIDNMRAHDGPQVIVAAILHGANAAEIPALLGYVRQRELQLVIQPLYENFGERPHDPHWHRQSPLWPKDLAPVEEALDLLAKTRAAGGPVCNPVEQLHAMKGYFRDPLRPNGLTCRAGHSDLAVDPKGQLRLCFFLEPVGSILDGKSPERAWIGPRALRRRWQVSRCQRPCNLLNCNFEGE